MAKKSKEALQFRYYEIPQNQPLLALLGQKWIQNYGLGIGYQHFHNLMEIGYCYGGEGVMELDGRIERYGAGTITLIPANFPHNTKSDPDTLSRFEYLFVDVESFLKERYSKNPVFLKDLVKRINHGAICTNAQSEPALEKEILYILNEMRDQKELYIEAVQGALLTLLVDIARVNRDESAPLENSSVDITVVAQAIDMVTDHYYEPLQISDLSRACNMSETHFRRVFEKCMNMKPMEYINLVRVQMACEYMKKHDDSMEIVAIKSGFATTSTMNRNFKKILDISPYQWKSHPENYQGKLLNYKISAYKGW